jgi:hypothetical protein
MNERNAERNAAIHACSAAASVREIAKRMERKQGGKLLSFRGEH